VTDSNGVTSALAATATAKVSGITGGSGLAGSSGGGAFAPAALLPLLFGAALRRRRRG
jgi:hypothetical protein